ncbi:hypothetical protein MPH_08728 [Macrophomina phaseolina MS6]|uniref:Uncharacterized protein n=1 Tax=Macrophomina phaseolina (strain MS6) TaxID=1126212 RepID=K2RHN5_MACPH|nr:hypothetical protein MPH_08728 [Macrophomina phaseolina MS6]
MKQIACRLVKKGGECSTRALLAETTMLRKAVKGRSLAREPLPPLFGFFLSPHGAMHSRRSPHDGPGSFAQGSCWGGRQYENPRQHAQTMDGTMVRNLPNVWYPFSFFAPRTHRSNPSKLSPIGTCHSNV